MATAEITERGEEQTITMSELEEGQFAEITHNQNLAGEPNQGSLPTAGTIVFRPPGPAGDWVVSLDGKKWWTTSCDVSVKILPPGTVIQVTV